MGDEADSMGWLVGVVGGCGPDEREWGGHGRWLGGSIVGR